MISDIKYCWICQKKNLPQELSNQSKFNEIYICDYCVQENINSIPKELLNGSNKRIIDQFKNQINKNNIMWKLTKDSLVSLQGKFQKSIEIIQSLIDGINNYTLLAMNTLQEIQSQKIIGKDIQLAQDRYLIDEGNFKKQITQQIEAQKQTYFIDNIINCLIQTDSSKFDSQELKDDNKFQQVQSQDINQVENKKQKQLMKYNYQLINEFLIQNIEFCNDIAFNNDLSIIIMACSLDIKVFEFKQNKLKELQIIKKNSNSTNILFMKMSNQFMENSGEKIIVWRFDKGSYSYLESQRLNLEISTQCFTINQKEDLIAVGTHNKFILFLQLCGNQWQFDQRIQCSGLINSLSFNNSNTNLISCNDQGLITIFEEIENEWIPISQIQVENHGNRICFISDNQFVFNQWKSETLYFYEYDQQRQKFETYQKVKINNGGCDKSGFPIKFIKQKNLLIVKAGQYVNVLRRLGNGDFVKDQAIKFEAAQSFRKGNKTNCYLFGSVCEDGNFLLTWDKESRKLQIRGLIQMPL